MSLNKENYPVLLKMNEASSSLAVLRENRTPGIYTYHYFGLDGLSPVFAIFWLLNICIAVVFLINKISMNGKANIFFQT